MDPYTARKHRSDPQDPILEEIDIEYQVNVTVPESGNPAGFRYALSDPSVSGPETVAAPVQANLEAQGASPAAMAQSEQMIRSPATGMAIQLKEPAPLFLLHCVGMNVGQGRLLEHRPDGVLNGRRLPRAHREPAAAHIRYGLAGRHPLVDPHGGG